MLRSSRTILHSKTTPYTRKSEKPKVQRSSPDVEIYSSSPHSAAPLSATDSPLPVCVPTLLPPDGLSPSIAPRSLLFSGSDEDRGCSPDAASDATPSEASGPDEEVDKYNPKVKEESDSEVSATRDPSPQNEAISDAKSDATMSDEDSLDESEDTGESRSSYANSHTIRGRYDTVSSQKSVSMHSVRDDFDWLAEALTAQKSKESSLNDWAQERDRSSFHPEQISPSHIPTTLPQSRAETSSAQAGVITLRILQVAPHGPSGSLNASGPSNRLAPVSYTITIPPGAHLELSINCGCSCSSVNATSVLRKGSEVVYATTAPDSDSEVPGDAQRDFEADGAPSTTADAQSKTSPRVVTSPHVADPSSGEGMDFVQSSARQAPSPRVVVAACDSDDVASAALVTTPSQVSPRYRDGDDYMSLLPDAGQTDGPSHPAVNIPATPGICWTEWDVADNRPDGTVDHHTSVDHHTFADQLTSCPTTAALMGDEDKHQLQWDGGELPTADAIRALAAMSRPHREFGFPIHADSAPDMFLSYVHSPGLLPATDPGATATSRTELDSVRDDDDAGGHASFTSLEFIPLEPLPQQCQEQLLEQMTSLSYPHSNFGFADHTESAPGDMFASYIQFPESLPASDARATAVSRIGVDSIREDHDAEGEESFHLSLPDLPLQQCQEQLLKESKHLGDLQEVIAARQGEIARLLVASGSRA
ncbi:hypothetical protein K466DRAFT_661912 [Polyporus arcularius HHB13444]|uniref:Uncharacterized protein n=1 Tax=Polyporus arcularius HHB13444 TaxID=1314778 RepID=A0A5C3PHC2_9APHY|nr:hypothetical protein K466DRAFT_661912 [Polyporus arcularius HHB13444]